MLIQNDDHISTQDLNMIVHYIEITAEESSKVLEGLSDCCKALRKIRNCVMKRDWVTLQQIAHDENTKLSLSLVPESEVEVKYALKESYNSNVVENLELALKTPSEADPNQYTLEIKIDFAKQQEITGAVLTILFLFFLFPFSIVIACFPPRSIYEVPLDCGRTGAAAKEVFGSQGLCQCGFRTSLVRDQLAPSARVCKD